MNFLKKLLRKTSNFQSYKHSETDMSSSAIMQRLTTATTEERIKQIMIIGDSGQPEYFEILKNTILNDPDLNVKFSALKRIHFFKGHEQLIPFLENLQKSSMNRSLEPYLSMAMLRVGLINEEEFRKQING